jgi:ABC-type amino acid transport substrate-binding protein
MVVPRSFRGVFWALLIGVFVLVGGPVHAANPESSPPDPAAAVGDEAPAQAEDAGEPSGDPKIGEKPALKIVTKLFVPFAFEGEDGEWNGFSIDLWSHIAARLGLEYSISGADSLTEVLQNVQFAGGDVGVAGITITSERESKLDFTHPFYESGLQIMVNRSGDGDGGWGVIEAFLSAKFASIMGFFFIVLLLCGHVIWLTERNREDSDFRSGYLPGVWDGFWWSAVTVTTVGYGDKVPKGVAGRVVGLVWMFTSLFLISYFTASVTTALTVERLGGGISGPSELPGKKVGAPRGTTAAKYLVRAGARTTQCDTIDECYSMLRNEQVVAVVFDAPVLQYYASTEGNGELTTVGPVFQRESYGFALPTGSPLREQINKVLLDVREDGTYGELQKKWFGSE